MQFILGIMKFIWKQFNPRCSLFFIHAKCMYQLLTRTQCTNLYHIDNTSWKFSRSGQKASLWRGWSWYKWGHEIFSGGGVAVQPTGWMSSITCYTRYTSHPPTATHMIVSHRSQRETSHVVWLNHIQVDHTVFTTNHIYATVARGVGNNLSPISFCTFHNVTVWLSNFTYWQCSKSWIWTQKQLLDFISGGFARSRWHCSTLLCRTKLGPAELLSPGI